MKIEPTTIMKVMDQPPVKGTRKMEVDLHSRPGEATLINVERENYKCTIIHQSLFIENGSEPCKVASLNGRCLPSTSMEQVEDFRQLKGWWLHSWC